MGKDAGCGGRRPSQTAHQVQRPPPTHLPAPPACAAAAAAGGWPALETGGERRLHPNDAPTPHVRMFTRERRGCRRMVLCRPVPEPGRAAGGAAAAATRSLAEASAAPSAPSSWQASAWPALVKSTTPTPTWVPTIQPVVQPLQAVAAAQEHNRGVCSEHSLDAGGSP